MDHFTYFAPQLDARHWAGLPGKNGALLLDESRRGAPCLADAADIVDRAIAAALDGTAKRDGRKGVQDRMPDRRSLRDTLRPLILAASGEGVAMKRMEGARADAEAIFGAALQARGSRSDDRPGFEPRGLGREPRAGDQDRAGRGALRSREATTGSSWRAWARPGARMALGLEAALGERISRRRRGGEGRAP